MEKSWKVQGLWVYSARHGKSSTNCIWFIVHPDSTGSKAMWCLHHTSDRYENCASQIASRCDWPHSDKPLSGRCAANSSSWGVTVLTAFSEAYLQMSKQEGQTTLFMPLKNWSQRWGKSSTASQLSFDSVPPKQSLILVFWSKLLFFPTLTANEPLLERFGRDLIEVECVLTLWRSEGRNGGKQRAQQLSEPKT